MKEDSKKKKKKKLNRSKKERSWGKEVEISENME